MILPSTSSDAGRGPPLPAFVIVPPPGTNSLLARVYYGPPGARYEPPEGPDHPRDVLRFLTVKDNDEKPVGPIGRRADGCEVVCTLPQASLPERVQMVEREILPHVVASAPIADGFRLEFAADAGIRGRLERWAELERACCRDARFVIEEDGRSLRLTVHGIDPRGIVPGLES